MKRGLFKQLGVGIAVAAFCGSGVLMAMAGGSVITAGGTVTTEKLADGVVLTTEKGAKSAKGNQNLYTVIYDYDDPNYDLVLGGPLHGKPTLSTMAKMVDAMDNCTVLAGANADFFDMSGTGVPMGMSMENGRIVESPVADRAAEGYQYHALGITQDGKVLAGYNPTLVSTYQIKGADDAVREPIDFINRNRTPGVNIVLYTEDFGASTFTKKDTQGSYEVRLQIRSGAVSPQANPLVATVEAVSEEGNMAINKNTVVLSAQGTRMSDLKKLEIGDTLEMNFGFVEEEWNDVDFAIGGAYAFVQNGKAMDTDYGDESNPDMDGPAFTAVNPRTALGITKEGKIVLLVTDGRGAGGGTGFDAKELAHYMAEDMGCEFAILLDGGGSSEMVARKGNQIEICNTPSDPSATEHGRERGLGNGIFIVKRDEPRENTETTVGTRPQVADPVSLMPQDIAGATVSGLTAAMEGDSIKLTASQAGGSITLPVDVKYNAKQLPHLCFDLDTTARFDIKFNYSGKASGSPGLVSDFGPNFGLSSDSLGDAKTGLPAGTYTYETGNVQLTGAYGWNNGVPDNGIVTMKSIQIMLKSAGTMTLNDLFVAAYPMAYEKPVPTESESKTTETTDTTATQPIGTEPSESAVSSDKTSETTAVEPTAAPEEPTGTVSKTDGNPKTGENAAGALTGAITLAVSAGLVVFARKKKA